MIKINLLGEVKKADNSARLYVVGFVGSILILGVVLFFVHQTTTARVVELREETQLLEIQLAKIKEKTKAVRELEAKRKELQDKLTVIATLKRSKTGPVRVLDDINTALPERAWLVNLAESGGNLRLAGLALDNQTIASFMKGLERSSYFETVELVETKQSIDRDVRIKSFLLDARVSYAGGIVKDGAAEAEADAGAEKESAAQTAESAAAPAEPQAAAAESEPSEPAAESGEAGDNEAAQPAVSEQSAAAEQAAQEG